MPDRRTRQRTVKKGRNAPRRQREKMPDGRIAADARKRRQQTEKKGRDAPWRGREKMPATSMYRE